VTVKLVAEMAAPLGVCTVIGPVVAAEGTLTTIWVALSELILALTPLKVTDVAPVNPLPVMVTLAPGAPDNGLNFVMDTGEVPVVAWTSWFSTFSGVPLTRGTTAYSDGTLPGNPVIVSLVTAPTVANGEPLNWVRLRKGGFGIGSGHPGADQTW
jgi:hypothetical protein